MSQKGIKIVFMGTPEFAEPSFVALANKKNLAVAVTQPDRPSGRGQAIGLSPIKVKSMQYNVPVIQIESIKHEKSIEQMKKFAPDLIVVVAFGQILPQEVLDIPRMGVINVHASLLPKWRGAAPINWAILNGDYYTGVTTMLMDKGLDTGDILLQKKTRINDGETAVTLSERLSRMGAELLLQTIDGMEKGEIEPKPQNEKLATLAPTLTKEDGRIDWTKSAEYIARQVRAMDPWPGTFSFLHGKRFKVFSVEVAATENNQAKPGEIIEINDQVLKIATDSGALLLKELQLEGRKRLPVEEFVKGVELQAGQIVG
ncbi:MAG: methionyl-tRNA formyltransferase [Deltaproteobacteria bacterium]|nr:methionyl-tRNA formyltransferase [Deltaproteobacteria bacterium]